MYSTILVPASWFISRVTKVGSGSLTQAVFHQLPCVVGTFSAIVESRVRQVTMPEPSSSLLRLNTSGNVGHSYYKGWLLPIIAWRLTTENDGYIAEVMHGSMISRVVPVE